jgi:hypothetical protein
VRELERWARYWYEEPWGPHRDNLHAALIVTELLRPQVQEGANLNIDNFMLKPKEDRDAAARAHLVASLSAMAAAGERKARKGKKR